MVHFGCELEGPLSLRLDHIAPRFITRYHAILAEINRVSSEGGEDQEEGWLLQLELVSSQFQLTLRYLAPQETEQTAEVQDDHEVPLNDESEAVDNSEQLPDNEKNTDEVAHHSDDLPDVPEVEQDAPLHSPKPTSHLDDPENADVAQDEFDYPEGPAEDDQEERQEEQDGLEQEQPYENEDEEEIEEYEAPPGSSGSERYTPGTRAYTWWHAETQPQEYPSSELASVRGPQDLASETHDGE